MTRPFETGLRQEFICAGTRAVAQNGAIALACVDGEPTSWTYGEDFDRVVAWYYGLTVEQMAAIRSGQCVMVDDGHDTSESDTADQLPADADPTGQFEASGL